MVRRRPATVIGALCVALTVVVVPSAPVHAVGPGARVVVTELPGLTELPPLPTAGEPSDNDDDEVDSTLNGMSVVQTVALALALAVLVAGGVGLAVVTRRGRGDLPDDRLARTGPGP